MGRVGAVGVLLAGAAGVIAARRARQSHADVGSGETRTRWRSVTILASPDQVMPGGQVPEPLAALGDLVEVEVAPAPGDKGTELRARLRRPEPSGLGGVAARVTGNDPRSQVRSALREAKQLIEVGEVLRVDPAPHGPRKPTPGGLLLEAATKRAGGEGLL